MLLLKNADLLLFEDGVKILKCGYLGIDGNRISYIGIEPPKETYSAQKDMTGHLLMPGIYNMHTHASMTLLRGLGSGLPLDKWLHDVIFPVEARLTAEDISVGTRLAMLEMLASGIVSFSDMYDNPDITADEVLKAGMRANLNRPLLVLSQTEDYEANWRVQKSRRFFSEYNGAGNGKIVADFGIHAEYTSQASHVQRYAEECLQAGAIMHLHLSETSKEHEACKARYNKTPTEWFYDLGVFENPTVAAHCVKLEERDIELLCEKGVVCVHNPTSNMKLGSGFMPIKKLIKAGLMLTLGTDGAASNNNLNMFEEMHLAAIIHNGFSEDPELIKPEDILLMATKNGAAAQARPDCGELAIGNKADIIAVKTDAPHLLPCHGIPALLVYSCQASDVSMTMVDGVILYENGVYHTLDVEKIKYDTERAISRQFG
ncbi:MAG: 5-methylthioadenosine/S-adenosylhomocysteine deaminase [Firmicutes bacterium ADurb.Bin356]|nr:MAG: 5-methylthioadenosine/S-adenosylhomocysteine deaminase [Firmicutes bacterium ADurb.Bin356]